MKTTTGFMLQWFWFGKTTRFPSLGFLKNRWPDRRKSPWNKLVTQGRNLFFFFFKGRTGKPYAFWSGSLVSTLTFRTVSLGCEKKKYSFYIWHQESFENSFSLWMHFMVRPSRVCFATTKQSEDSKWKICSLKGCRLIDSSSDRSLLWKIYLSVEKQGSVLFRRVVPRTSGKGKGEEFLDW